MRIKDLFIPPRQLNRALDGLQKGDLQGGPLVLRHFVQCVEAGKSPDERAMKFISEALENSLDAYYTGHKHDLSEALGLLYTKGRPKMRTIGKVYFEVKYVEEVLDLMQGGETYEKAVAMVAKSHGVSESKIKTYYTRLKKKNSEPIEG